MMNLDAKAMSVFAHPLVNYTTSIALIWQVSHMLGLEDEDAKSKAMGRIHRYVKSMEKVRQILHDNTHDLIQDDVSCNTTDNQNGQVKLFLLRLRDTSSQLVQLAGDAKVHKDTMSAALDWFRFVKQIAEHVSPQDEDLNEITKSIKTNRLCFLRNVHYKNRSDNGSPKHFKHFCPKLNITVHMTTVHVVLEKSYSQSWLGLCKNIFTLLGMNCGQYWRSTSDSLNLCHLPYGIDLDLTKLLFGRLEKNLLDNKDNFAQDAAIMTLKALQFRMADLVLNRVSTTEHELEQGEHFSAAVNDLTTRLEQSRCLSVNSNSVSYSSRPPHVYRANNVGNDLRGFAFIMGPVSNGDCLLVKLMRSMSGNVNSNYDEPATPLLKKVSGWGVPTSMLNVDGDSTEKDLTAMLEEEVGRRSPTKRTRVTFTDEERQLVIKAREKGLKWDEIIERHSVLSDNGKTAQNIKDMWFNLQKKKNRTVTSSKTTRSPFSLEEKQAVADGLANGWLWARIKEKNRALLVERSPEDIRMLWKTIEKGIDSTVLNDHTKLTDYLRSSHIH